MLILAPKNLLSQWQDELRRMLAVPSARWLNCCWITEDGAEWKSDPTSCPRVHLYVLRRSSVPDMLEHPRQAP